MTKQLSIRSYNKSSWIAFIENNRIAKQDSHPSDLIVDFTHAEFLEPFHIVTLASLIEEYHQVKVKISFRNAENKGVSSYLSYIRFCEYWNEGFNRNNYTTCRISTTLCLWHINHPMISQYVDTAQKYFENNILRGKDAEPLNLCLSELFNNINDHSESSISGYCINQYYRKNKKMKIAVCDFGVGIPNTVNRYLKEIGEPILENDKALLKAFEFKFSSKSKPHNQGRGLDTLKGIIKECDGFLRVISNNSCLIIRDGKLKCFKLDYEFNGTYFDISLNTEYFEEQTNKSEDFDY